MNPMTILHETFQAEQSRRRQREQLLEGENEALKLIVERAPLEAVLDLLARVAERQSSSGLLASILLLDAEGVHLRHGAAPSLSRAYSEAIDGVAIGPNTGSCGTAAYLGAPVVVTDISSDPRWADYRELAAQHGLCACWSTPILSRKKTVLGTFALYYTYACTPDPDDEAMISILTRTAALAIEHHRAVIDLSESEERFRCLSRCAPLGVFMTDPSQAFTYVNPRFIEIASFEYEKTFDRWLESAAGDPHIVAEWRKAVAARLEYAREFAVTRAGATGAVMVRAAPLKSSSGTYLGYVGTLEDMSALLAANAELRSESRLRRAIEQSVPSGIAAVSADGTQTYVNPAFAAMVGWPADELVGRKEPFVYWPADQAAAIQEEFSRMRTGTAPSGVELQFCRRSGELFDVLVTVARLSGDDGEVSGWVGSFSDVSDRKRAEQAHARAEARLSLALDAARMGAWEWDLAAGAISWSPQLEAIHGIPKGSFGGTFADFEADIDPNAKDRVIATIQQALKDKSDYHVEYAIIRPDRSAAVLEARGRVLCNDAGEAIRMVGVCMDITDRRSRAKSAGLASSRSDN